MLKVMLLRFEVSTEEVTEVDSGETREFETR